MVAKKVSGIYSITNLISGKKYYGSSVSVFGRQRQHWSDLKNGRHKNPHLQAAWNKYGEAAFEFSIIEELPQDRLVEAEQRYLDKNEGGYNIGKFAYAPARGRKRTPESIAKTAAANRGRTFSEAHRKALSIAGMGRKMTDAQRAAASARMMGNKLSESAKRKLSESVASMWADAGRRASLISAQTAGKQTELAKQKYSDTSLTRWADRDYAAKMSVVRKRMWSDPEFKARMMEVRKIQGQRLREKNQQQKERQSALS